MAQYIAVGDIDRRIIEIDKLLIELPIERDALKDLRRGAKLVDGPLQPIDDTEHDQGAAIGARPSL